MAPGAHLLTSWLTGVGFLKTKRERVIIALSGVAPDLDGAGIIVDTITGNSLYYEKYHHYLGHSLLAAIVLASLAGLLAKSQKSLVWALSFFVT